MRIYSNKHLTAIERIHLWEHSKSHIIHPFFQSSADMIYKIDNVNHNYISFIRSNQFVPPPIDFITQFVWEYPDKQVGVCSLDLRVYDICKFDKMYRDAIKLPEGVSVDDLVYVDTTKLVRYELL